MSSMQATQEKILNAKLSQVESVPQPIVQSKKIKEKIEKVSKEEFKEVEDLLKLDQKPKSVVFAMVNKPSKPKKEEEKKVEVE